MAYVHVAHDVRVGNHTVLGNAVTFAGHVMVEDWAVIEAFSGVHQFCRVGRHAFVGGYSVITQDVLPFSLTVSPRDSRVFGENKVGLERRGVSKEAIENLHKAFRLLTKSGLNTTQAVERISREVEICAGDRGAAGVHRRVRARFRKVSRYGMIAGQRPFSVAGARNRAPLGR